MGKEKYEQERKGEINREERARARMRASLINEWVGE